MLVAFTFRAAEGNEKKVEALLNNPELAKRFARAVGARRNVLFMQGGRVVRVLEFPEGVKPRSIADAAREDVELADMLRQLGPLLEEPFDFDQPGSLDAFNKRILLPCVFDVSGDVMAPSRVEM